ncbi:GMC oxidoreductase-domain-containing protein [Diaporthe sp. PMI_573]|nr:GMC oxidoreductase-domain-containing protein [Diaporthaceae sp. PMI_573]
MGMGSHASSLHHSLLHNDPKFFIIRIRLKAWIYDEGLERAGAFVHETAVAAYHWTSSCAMLPRDESGVVDTQLRVYGARRLRVVDASIFPLITRASTMATVYTVAERAAEIIKSGQ